MSDPKTFCRCKNMLEVLCHLAEFEVGTSLAAGYLLFVCACLSAILSNDRDCAHDFALKVLEYRNDFDTTG